MLLEDSVLETEKPKRTTATFFVVVCFLVFVFFFLLLFVRENRKPRARPRPTSTFPDVGQRCLAVFFLMSLVPVLRSRGFELPLDC